MIAVSLSSSTLFLFMIGAHFIDISIALFYDVGGTFFLITTYFLLKIKVTFEKSRSHLHFQQSKGLFTFQAS